MKETRRRDWTVYALRHQGNVIYVGLTSMRLAARFTKHISSAKFPETGGTRIPKLFAHMKENNFTGYTIELLEVFTNQEDGFAGERKHIALFGAAINGCNTSPGGVSSGEEHYLYGKPACSAAIAASVAARTGKKLSEEHKEKIGAAGRGRQYPTISKPVICSDGQEFRTSREAAKHFGISMTTIKRLCESNRPCKKGDSKGLELRYKENT